MDIDIKSRRISSFPFSVKSWKFIKKLDKRQRRKITKFYRDLENGKWKVGKQDLLPTTVHTDFDLSLLIGEK
jgi:hypothetical protein